MEKIKDYKLCHGLTEAKLEEAVRAALAEGWQPLGSLIVHRDALVQAVVRHVDKEGTNAVPEKPAPKEEGM